MKIRNGFTLIELLVVVLIIGILAAIALPGYQKAVEKSRWTEAIAHVNALSDAWERHYLATNTYTSNMSDLDVSVPNSSYFSTPLFHTSPLPHIQTMRKNSTGSGLWVTRYSTTKMTYCTAGNGDTKNKDFCAMFTGQSGAACPEPGYTCYQIR